MGSKLCYLAINATPESILGVFDLSINSSSTEMPVGDCWIAELKTGWSILWSEDLEFGQNSIKAIDELSYKADIYVTEVHEGVMWSACSLWRTGRKVWQVQYAGEDGPDINRLLTKGELPERFESIKTKALEEQNAEGNGMDYLFDIAISLAKEATGFECSDELLSERDVEAFYVLSSINSSSGTQTEKPLSAIRSIFAILFGKR